MNMLNRRGFMMAGIGALALAGIAVATTGPGPEGYEHLAMSVEDMRASGALVVDIRTPPEWAETGVIDGAVLETFAGVDSFLARVGPEIADGRDLVLICRSGNRTRAAAEALAGRIPNRIISVEGGMRQVLAAGYQPVTPG